LSHRFLFFNANFTENQYLMAKTISDEQMKLSIIINGNEAQKELFDLEKSTRSLNEQNKALLLQKKLLEKQGQKDTAQYKLLSATIKANSTEVTNNKNRMAELQKEIGLTGLTMGQLQSKATMLRNTLRNLIPGSDDYVRYQAELTQVNSRLGELSGRSRTAQSSISSLADTFNRYQGMAIAVIGALTGVVLSIQKIIDINGKLSDAQSDVMKTTGMTKVEVDELTKSFGLLQTRTSRIDLLGIAEQGGRIGIAKAEIGDFVSVMNKASVSLGDSFTGGAEEVANKLGKIKFLFQETKDLNVEQAYNSIGSAINDLGANGVASEANIADFTTRIGSLTDVLKPTIQQTLALGTAFEESGIESEVSARAYGIFMKQASTETAKFAKVMNLTQGEVESMINTNPLEFMLKFSEGMKGMNATDTAKTLDSLGISADGANKVIGAMGNNTARFRELIDLSNKSFGEGTSLINEYNIKNNNLAATLEKISKTISGWFSSETFIKWLTAGVQALGKMIGATDDANGSISSLADKFLFFVKTFALILVTLFNYQVALKLVALWTTRVGTATAWSNLVMNIHYGLLVIQEVATKALAFAQSFLTLKLSEVKKAFVALSASMNLNPWVALFTIVTSLIAAYAIFKDSADETSKVFENQVLINNKVTEQLSDQKQKVSDLTAIMKDENATIEQKKEALTQLQKIAGGYLDTLTQENIATAEGTRLIGRYIKAIDELATAQAIQDVKAELRKEKLKQDNKVLALSMEKKANKNEGVIGTRGDDGKFLGFGGRNKVEIQNEIDAEKEKQTQMDFQITALENRKTRAITEIQTAIRIRNEKLKKAKKDSQQFKELTQSIKNDEKALNVLIGLESTKEETPGSKFNPLDNAGANGTGADKTGGKEKQLTYLGILQKKLDAVNKSRENLVNADGIKNDGLFQALTDQAVKLNEEIAKVQMTLSLKDMNEELSTIAESKIKFATLTIKDEKELQIAILEIRKEQYSGELMMAMKMNMKKQSLTEHEKKMIEESAKNERDTINKLNELKNSSTDKATKDYIQKIKGAFDLDKIIRETKFNEEYAALGNNERAKAALKKEFEAKELDEQAKFLKELIGKFNEIVGDGKFQGMDMSLLTPEQVESFKAEAAKVGLTLSELIAKKNELSGKQMSNADALGVSKGTTDIFGFTPDNWVAFSDNLAKGKFGIDEMVFALSALTDAWGKYNEFVTANENAKMKKFEQQSDAKKIKLKKQLDSGVISQKTYDKQISKIDTELDAKKADLEYKQAKRQKALSVMNIIMSTAQAIIGIWAQFPKMDFGITAGIMSGVVGALGALQLATVLATPLPAKGHEEGLYQDYVTREQDGKKFKSSYGGKTRSGLVSKTSHFLVAENGPEMVIDAKAWRQMNPEVKDSLIRELRGVKGFEQGLYNQAVQRYEVPAASPTSSGNDTQMLTIMMSLVAENTAVLKDIKQSGILAIVSSKDLPSMKNIKEGIEAYNDLRTKSKK
jgi:TP901 family phage tail tape measure protein